MPSVAILNTPVLDQVPHASGNQEAIKLGGQEKGYFGGEGKEAFIDPFVWNGLIDSHVISF